MESDYAFSMFYSSAEGVVSENSNALWGHSLPIPYYPIIRLHCKVTNCHTLDIRAVEPDRVFGHCGLGGPLPSGDSLRQNAQDLIHHRGADQRSVPRRVERRRYLNDIAPDQVKSV